VLLLLLLVLLLRPGSTLTCHHFDQDLAFPAGRPGEVCFL
jgi:hypothetical protein